VKKMTSPETADPVPVQAGTAGGRPWTSKRWRLVISILIIGHLLAVAMPPLAFQAGPSPSVASLLWPVRGYGQFLYLDRGYAFFAPDPGPSHLIQAAITEPDGKITEAMYPDLQQQWPRLKYHRHFMLAEYLNEIYELPGPPPELVEADPEAADQWARLRRRYELVRQSMRDHLQHVSDKFVQIRRIEHLIPTHLDYLNDPIPLSDPRRYIVLLDQPLDAPAGPPEPIPAPGERDDGTVDSLTAPVASGTTDEVNAQPQAVPTSEDSR
jgi:hypothetical protein